MRTLVATFAAALASVAFAREMPINSGVLYTDLDANGFRIVNVDEPQEDGDAANKAYVDAHGGGSSIKTNAVIDIANATIATNPVVAAKLDGPTVTPTNIAENAGKAADAQKTGIALTNRYTRAETDAKLAEKADVEMISEANETFKTAVVGSMNSTGISSDAINIGGTISGLSVSDQYGDLREGINTKADRAYSSGEVLTDEIATLDVDGNPTRSGIAKDDMATKDEIPSYYLTLNNGTIAMNDGSEVNDSMLNSYYFGSMLDEGLRLLDNRVFSLEDNKADISMISATNATFAAEVLAVQVASLSTNITAEVYIAATNACANLGIDPALIPQGGTLGTVGGLLIALAAAVALLRKKTALLESDGKATETFATDLLGKQVAISAIDARLPYPLNTDGTIKDRAINVVTSGAFVIPEGFHDLLIRYTGVPASLTFSGTDASIADYGDDLPTETGDYLVTVTRTKAAECYIRIVTLEARA